MVVSDDPDVTVAQVRLAHIRPYVSLLVLQIEDFESPQQVFDTMLGRVRSRRRVAATDVSIVASGLEVDGRSIASSTGAPSSPPVAGFDQGAALVLRRMKPAPWAMEGSPYIDVEHELFLAVRRGQLVAVSGSESAHRAVTTWLDKPPLPAIRRVRIGSMNAALLGSGEARTMWLKHTRGKSAIRPDAKSLSGLDLEPTLDPIGDGSYALSSVRIQMPEQPPEQIQRTAFTGTVGTTPRKSRVWSGPSGSAGEFFTAVEEVLAMIQDALDAGADLTNPFSRLAAHVDSLDGVQGAFEFSCPGVEEMIAHEATPEQIAAAEALQGALIVAEPVPGSADVVLHVGYGASTSGQLRVSVREDRGEAQVRIGMNGEPSDAPTVIDIRDKLDQVGDFSIHYMSGHAVLGRGIYAERREVSTFNGWRFEDMSGYRIDREKPPVAIRRRFTPGSPSTVTPHCSPGSPTPTGLVRCCAMTDPVRSPTFCTSRTTALCP